MKLDKKFIETVTEEMRKYVLNVYDECRLKHINAKKMGKDTLFIWCECLVKGIVGEWKTTYYLGLATNDGYLDIYECNFEDTIVFDVKED